jgi:hypothetical protein
MRVEFDEAMCARRAHLRIDRLFELRLKIFKRRRIAAVDVLPRVDVLLPGIDPSRDQPAVGEISTSLTPSGPATSLATYCA